MITNTVNGKAYIGQTIHDAVKGRIREHFNGGHGGSRLVKRAIKKYGKDVFTVEILHDGIIPEFLDMLEIEAIAKHNTVAPNGYNLATGGAGTRGCKCSNETRQKISQSTQGRIPHNLGKKHSPETCRKISESNKGRKAPNLGKKHSAEHCKKLSEANKGERHPFYGKKHSPETLQKLSILNKGENNPNYGKRHVSYTDAYNLFNSLSADMPIREKRKRLFKAFPNVHVDTMRQWIRDEWT